MTGSIDLVNCPIIRRKQPSEENFSTQQNSSRSHSWFSGTHGHTEVVVAGFPDHTALEAWHASPAYQALVPLRMEAAEVDLLSYDS